MKKLENYSVKELNTIEASVTDGGWWVTISGGWFNWTSLYGDNTDSSIWA